MSVGLVIVSHSAQLAAGVRELAAQMAPDVRVQPAGGMGNDAIGTDFERVSTALSDADTGSGAVLLYDLGSAQMVAELAVESLGDPGSAVVAEAPLVEGAVAAAVAAQGGADVRAVARAAESAAEAGSAGSAGAVAAAPEPTGQVEEDLQLTNEVGLHARPAALLARSLAGLQAEVEVVLGDKPPVQATSVLGLMGLGAQRGDTVRLRADGPDAREALDRIRALAQRNFDE
ncbi:PTS-dependent dihydroxyacetone kinase phosphotransferase subunit DhaM [Saccharopolyspora sp. HNM0983]|uniref:Phosphocarrier protein HPr n=1 Tax=Saccharopolyspora montiporae TaxID=2781240 RepID=A0A929BDB1_9PSEU|nr:dihydroxyacetone kinase phosphoryl donor subunit DhaM [Saccharopolyspora sp. HNM0983]MBE9376270.1 PTS-dependent dihydroxyacetone kinase phosphotransferase subunit DhaM [Saccharopolyspora sp. HNM0983]